MKTRKRERLYSLSEGVNDNVFNNIRFDGESKELIRKSCNETFAGFRRHAVVGFVPKAAALNSLIVEARSRPGLPDHADDETIKKAKEIFGKGKFVVAQEGMPGVVHFDTIKQADSIDPELKQLHMEQCFKFIGLSFYVTEMSGTKILSWLNRSVLNKELFKRNELALACLTFTFHATVDDILDHPEHTAAYGIERSAPKRLFMNFLDSAELDLGIRCIPDRDCYEAEKIWDNILKDSEEKQIIKIQELLMTNIYIGASRPPDSENASSHPPTNGYDTELKDIFAAAEKNEISIDLDFVPPVFKETTKNATALMMAVRQGYFQIVSLLIGKNAKLETRDDNGLTPLLWAALNGKFEMAELLIKNGAAINTESKAHGTVIDCFSHSIWNLISNKNILNIADRNNAIHIIKDFITRFSQFPEMMRGFPQILYKKNSLAGDNSLMSYLEIELDTHLKNNNFKAASELLNGLPVLVIKDLIDTKDTAEHTKLFYAINNKNNALSQFLIEHGASINFEDIRDCKDQALRLNLVHWTKMRGDEYKENPLDKFNSVSLPTMTMVFEKSDDNTQFYEYVKRCDLISSKIPKENIPQSSRYEAINNLYNIAKEFKTEQEFLDELSFFSKLDHCISQLNPDVKSEYLSAYKMYANRSIDLDVRKMILDDIAQKITKGNLDKEQENLMISFINEEQPNPVVTMRFNQGSAT